MRCQLEDTTGRLVFIEAWDSMAQWLSHTVLSAVATITDRIEGLLATQARCGGDRWPARR